MKSAILSSHRARSIGSLWGRAAPLVLLLVSILTAAAPLPARGAGSTATPNLVYILADDLGYGDLSCLNPQSKIATPSMDRLATEGMTFTDAHSPSSVCTPTRYGILTGRYCWRTRLTSGVLFGYDRPLIEPGQMTVASFLRRHGYRTAVIGKWHLGLGWQLLDGGSLPQRDGLRDDPGVDYTRPVAGGPLTLGFDYFFGISASLDMAPYCYLENDRVTTIPTEASRGEPFPTIWREGPKAKDFQHADVLPTITRKAVQWIDQQAEASPRRPFFLYFPLTAPHLPVVPNERFRGKSQAGPYGDFVVEVDWVVGQVLEALQRSGLAENTLVILTSDNGSVMTNRPEFQPYRHATNYHFRGQKSDAWDGGHRVPFLARWPVKVKPGSTCADTICLTDLLATCAAIVGSQLPAEAGPDSFSILPDLLGTAAGPIREATVHHSIAGCFAVRQGPWKLVLCRGSGGWSLPEARAPQDAPPGQLYNMRDDVGEKHNWYRERPEIVAQLTALVERYQKQGHSRGAK